jgi:release factor glutamine methyltransferase
MSAAPQRDENWTTRRLLNWTAEYLERKDVDSPRLSAELLLAHVLETERIKLFMDLDRPASPLERSAFRDLVERATAHEPVQYLTGEAHFFSLAFEVNADVLIPRPSTETLVEHVLQHARRTPGFKEPVVADIGTGSGCIAIAIAKHLPGSHVIAIDVSAAALEVAKRNAERHGVADRIEFRHGDLLEPMNEAVEYLCSNPPYIPDNEWEAVAPNVKDHEPTGALRGGADGLDVIRPLLAAAVSTMASPAQLVVEIAASQKHAAIDLANQTPGLSDARVLADAEGHPRVLVAERK